MTKKSLLDYLNLFDEIIEKNKNNTVMDLSDYDFLAPPTLLPLIQYMEHNGFNEYRPHQKTENYLEMVFGREKSTNTTIPLKKLKFYNTNNYFSLEDKIGDYLEDIIKEILSLIKTDLDESPIKLLLWELLTNIYKHSKFNNAYILCQEHPKINKVDVCIIDDGISIPGSFEEVGIEFINDSEAIYDAINCRSSDKEGEGLEGRGLNTCIHITSEGYDEEILIASRNGICVINDKYATLYENLNSNLIGTFISLRVNNNILKNNYSIYEKIKIKKKEG